MIIVKVIEEKCKGCSLCIDACPKGVLGISSKMNRRGFHPAEVIFQEKCTGCGLCFLMCPDVAIEIYEISHGAKK